MKIVEQSRLADALAAWGKHEALGRLGMPPETFNKADGLLTAVSLAAHTRPQLMARILVGDPIFVFKSEIEPADIPLLRLVDQRTIEQWKLAAPLDPAGFKYYRALADSPEPVEGPLICTAQTDGSKSYVPPIIVFDGWHRVAAWSEQLNRADYPISAYLIITKDPVPLMIF